jgi:uncharacterized membrane protein
VGPELWALAGLTLLGAVLRFSTLDLQSFWHDEAVTVGRVLEPSLFSTLGHVPGSEATPPLYYALVWAWTKAFGHGEVGIRSFSALCGTAAIPVAWWAGRALVSRAAGLGAAALTATSSVMVWYSQEARAYALLVLLCALSLALFAERRLVWWATVSALALLTHYFAVFVVGPELVLLLWLMPERRRAVLAAGGAVVAVGLALVPLAVHQANQGHDRWIAKIPLSTRVRETGLEFVLGHSGSPTRVLSVITALILAAVGAVAVLRARSIGRWWMAVAISAAALAVPLLAKLVGLDFYFSRNVLEAWVPLAVAVGAAAAVPRIGPPAVAALCAAFLVLTIAVDTNTRLQRADWRAAAAAIGPASAPRAVIVPAVGDNPIAYYLLRADRLSRPTANVAEIDVLAFTAAPRSRSRQVPAGFVQTARRHVAAFTLLRYTATQPRALTRPALARTRLGVGHAAVLEQLP